MPKESFICPACGWTVATPHGEADLVEAVSWHGGKIHPTMKMTREEILGIARSE